MNMDFFRLWFFCILFDFFIFFRKFINQDVKLSTSAYKYIKLYEISQHILIQKLDEICKLQSKENKNQHDKKGQRTKKFLIRFKMNGRKKCGRLGIWSLSHCERFPIFLKIVKRPKSMKCTVMLGFWANKRGKMRRGTIRPNWIGSGCFSKDGIINGKSSCEWIEIM